MRQARELLADRDLEVVPGHGLVEGEDLGLVTGPRLRRVQVDVVTARPAAVEGRPRVVGDRLMCLRVFRDPDDLAGGLRQPPEPGRRRRLGAGERALRGLEDLVSGREAECRVAPERGEGRAEVVRPELPPTGLDERGVDSLDLAQARLVDRRGIEVERGVEADHCAVGVLAARNVHQPGPRARPGGGRDPGLEDLAVATERRDRHLRNGSQQVPSERREIPLAPAVVARSRRLRELPVGGRVALHPEQLVDRPSDRVGHRHAAVGERPPRSAMTWSMYGPIARHRATILRPSSGVSTTW